jgi:hypothetical protein
MLQSAFHSRSERIEIHDNGISSKKWRCPGGIAIILIGIDGCLPPEVLAAACARRRRCGERSR